MTDATQLLNVLIQTAYSEPPTEHHHRIIEKVWTEIVKQYLKLGDEILDVGAGDGFAVQLFEREGFHATALNYVVADEEACYSKGLISIGGEMHALKFMDKQYNCVWMRHALEHSPFPMLALAEAYRVLKEDGYLYVEVPMSDTSCAHETNPNHWSLFSQRTWVQLFIRSGFQITEQREVSFQVQAGPDTYLCWLLRKGK